jgi:hypothetical protein
MAAKLKSSASSASSLPLSAEEAAFLAAAVEEGTKIQSRFRPEPLLARTGRGFMESSGVADIAAEKIKRRVSRK